MRAGSQVEERWWLQGEQRAIALDCERAGSMETAMIRQAVEEVALYWAAEPMINE